jgi:hypothetical protein
MKVSQGLKQHYATHPETNKKLSEGQKRRWASMTPEAKEAWGARMSGMQKARWERVRAAKAKEAAADNTSSWPQPDPADLPQPESTS